MLRMFAGVVIAYVVVASVSATERVPVSKIVVDKITKTQYEDVISLGLDFVETQGERFEILARPADRQKLEFLGIP